MTPTPVIADQDAALSVIRSLNYEVDVIASNPLVSDAPFDTDAFDIKVSADTGASDMSRLPRLRIVVTPAAAVAAGSVAPLHIYGLRLDLVVRGFYCGYQVFEWLARLGGIVDMSEKEDTEFMVTENGLHTALAVHSHNMLHRVQVEASSYTIQRAISSSGLNYPPPLSLPPPAASAARMSPVVEALC